METHLPTESADMTNRSLPLTLGCCLALLHCSGKDEVTLTGSEGVSTPPAEGPAPEPAPSSSTPTVQGAIREVFEHPTAERLQALAEEHRISEEEGFVMILYWAGLAEAEERGTYPDGFERVASALNESIAQWPSLSPTLGQSMAAIRIGSDGVPEGGCKAKCSLDLTSTLVSCASTVMSTYVGQLPSGTRDALRAFWKQVSAGMKSGKALDAVLNDVRSTSVLGQAAQAVGLIVAVIAGVELAGLAATTLSVTALLGLTELATGIGVLATVLGGGVCGEGLQARFEDAKRCRDWQIEQNCCEPVGVWSVNCYETDVACGLRYSRDPGVLRVHENELGSDCVFRAIVITDSAAS